MKLMRSMPLAGTNGKFSYMLLSVLSPSCGNIRVPKAEMTAKIKAKNEK